MPFSPVLSAFVWVTLAVFFVFTVAVVTNGARRSAFHRFLQGRAVQTAAVFLAAGLAAAMLAAIPVERDGRTDTLLQVSVEAVGAGIPEAGASAPFATVSATGEPLRHAGLRVKESRSPAVHVFKYTLVAFIAGGVTGVTAILFTAAFLAARRRIPFSEGVASLGGFAWKNAMTAGTLLWMVFTWLLLLWPDWHVLGTTAAGTDVFALLLGLSPWATAAGFWLLMLGFLRRGGFGTNCNRA